MAISKSKLKAGSLQFDNETVRKSKDDLSDAKLKNQQDENLLSDPEDDDGGSTHSTVTAAAEDLYDVDESIIDDSSDSEVEETEFPEGSVEAETDFDPEDEIIEGDLNLDAEDEDDELEDDVAEAEMEAELCADDGVPVVDVDSTDDVVEDADQLSFAAIGASLHVIKANRIIATMGKQTAVLAGKEDLYLNEQFPSVVAIEVQSKGLRKGLIASGFKLSRIKVESSKAVEAAVKQKLTAATASVVKATKVKEKALEQSLAIAAVGINRKFFKDVDNSLRAFLEDELKSAGVRNGSRIVKAAFQEHGIDYAKSLIQVASKLATMPESTREQMIAALDMTAEGEELDVDEDEEDLDNSFDELDVPASVNAAVKTPLRSNKVAALLQPTGSTTAAEILSGAKPLPFLFG